MLASTAVPILPALPAAHAPCAAAGCKSHKPDGCWRFTPKHGYKRMCPFCLVLPVMTILRKIRYAPAVRSVMLLVLHASSKLAAWLLLPAFPACCISY